MATALVWFRNDLRLDDHPALRAALEAGYTPVPVYIHAPGEEAPWQPGQASERWRQRSLQALDLDLRQRGAQLCLRHGPSLPALLSLLQQTGAEAVFWNRRYEPAVQARDARIKQALRAAGHLARSFNGSLLFEPWTVQTGQQGPYRVFTPYWRNLQTRLDQLPAPWDAPATLPQLPMPPSSLPLPALRLSSALAWDAGFWQHWQPGEAGAREALQVFIEGALNGYRSDRDRPDRVGTSLLSPHLHFGEVAPWRIAHRLQQQRNAGSSADIDAYLRELGWRDFAHHLLHHFPDSAQQDFNPRFAGFRWAEPAPALLQAWQRGQTGVPIVDAGMRELWATGYMHNRVRMIVASFLCKHLRMHWRHGAQWFWDTLVDADLANNSLGWQWTAGTGADAAPYFRVFNPVLQARKFDPNGQYIARWVPELASLPVPARFAPWQLPADARPPGYPANPIVDLEQGRDAALAAYRDSKV
ncbi:cryptochrome/photolyase family protein [Pseudoxanthomonas dokdonensis]|uniref:Deoxyribodipyrimidine photolyase n=1 Tax=Pseudoxanthomonas dokdonensis TaxID=344882 RepID=A0A0R0CXS1_9GAMM|nr:deoxyribodipyrimidine photo-lyase [Pseudoxanthomonas dokdonensis]KRG70609.1 deoxyribodipyrimidine photolyase [Pseudoxanthomonas dokdonensis]